MIIKNLKEQNNTKETQTLEDFIISSSMNGWILQLYLRLFNKNTLKL